jgi:hypothetical protein
VLEKLRLRKGHEVSDEEFARMLGEAVVANYRELSLQFTRGADVKLPNMKYLLIIGLCDSP